MKRSNAVRAMFLLGMIFAIVFVVRAEPGHRRTSIPDRKSAPPLRILDQNGQPSINGVPSPNGATIDVAVGQGGFVFVPDTVNISVGDTVRWTWATSGHSVTSGPPCEVDSQYCSPDDMNCASGVLSNQGTVYTHTFTQPGTYSYFCAAHCVIGMTGVVNVSSGCSSTSWSAGPDLPSVGTRLTGVYFQANGKFYSMGGRSSDVAGNEFTHPFEYDPATNAWTIKSATYPDIQVNNMACGVLAESGTPYIYCVGGSDVASQTTTGRVFRYDPVPDVLSSVGDPWPPGAATTTLPGGFTIFQNKLYILGGFNIPGGNATDEIWEFNPTTNAWVQKGAHLPVPLGFIPTTTIGTLIFTGGGSDITGGALTDTTNSFVYNPVGDSISTIASIPRATAETRALNVNNQMWVLGGGRTAPNPSNEVDIYDPVGGTWTTGLAFTTARRNFPADTDGNARIWLAGGYDGTGVPVSSMEIFCEAGPTPSPTPTATPTPTPTPTPSPTATPTPTLTPTATPSASPTPTPRSATLGNIATRLQVGTGANVMIAGFIVQGTAPKRVLIRAIGPSLTNFGVPDALANPRLELHDTSSNIGMNDDWQTTQIGGVITADQVAEIQASGLAPTDPLESAVIATLSPGSYTAIVQGVNGGTGVGSVEVYDLGTASASFLANIATRGFVETGANVMIGGFIVVTQPTRVIIRAIGPSLGQFGVPDPLANPQLELHDSKSLIGRNDDWQTTQIGGIITADQVAEIKSSQLAPTNALEAAIIATLAPGSYTAIVSGVNNTTGNALVEVYALP